MREKTVLVTGAGFGIGRSIAMAFGEQEAMVVVADICLYRQRQVSHNLRD